MCNPQQIVSFRLLFYYQKSIIIMQIKLLIWHIDRDDVLFI